MAPEAVYIDEKFVKKPPKVHRQRYSKEEIDLEIEVLKAS